jgi:4-amino-4-deoxy-L-arabinose transferase-like glycosyltransferase
VAAMGGALTFGALPRLARKATVSVVFAAGVGVAILANSRPFEGSVMVVLCFAALLWWTRGHFRVSLRPPILLAFSSVVLCTAIFMGYDNFQTTGHPATLPYEINQERYAAAPILWFLPPYPGHKT